MARHCRNAMRLAAFLEERLGSSCVAYPGLSSHPQHELASRQMRGGYGGVLALRLPEGADVPGFLRALRVFRVAESLGGVESLVAHPATMSHASVPEKVRASMGIDANLLRLSVGIEDADDLCEDVRQAIDLGLPR